MAAKTINGLHGRVIPCRAAIELDWVADVSSLGSLLDRLAARMSIDNVSCIGTLHICLRAIGTKASSSLPKPARRLAFRTRKPTQKAALRSGYSHLPGQHECARLRPAPTQGRPGGHWAVRVSGKWRLTFAFEAEDAILVDYQDYH